MVVVAICFDDKIKAMESENYLEIGSDHAFAN